MSFLLAAEAAGISCTPQAALASYPDVVREHLDSATGVGSVCGIAFGRAIPPRW